MKADMKLTMQFQSNSMAQQNFRIGVFNHTSKSEFQSYTLKNMKIHQPPILKVLHEIRSRSLLKSEHVQLKWKLY